VHFDALSADVVTRARMTPGVADATVYRNASVVNHAIGITDPGKGAVEIPAPMFGYRVVTPGYLPHVPAPDHQGTRFHRGRARRPISDRRSTDRALSLAQLRAVGSDDQTRRAQVGRPLGARCGVVGQADGFAGESGSARQENPAMRSRIGSVFVVATARDSFTVAKWL
jgi:hypothetical protein